jgi:hypothetical protein
MTTDAVLVGEIAHIEGALPESARFNAAMTNEQRRGYENLLLMCGTHHTVVDRGVSHWTVERLRGVKRTHEAVYTSVIDRLRRQVGDVTEGVGYTPAANGRALLHGSGLNRSELAESRGEINRFAERLSKVPGDARSLLELIVVRGDEVPSHLAFSHWSAEFQIPVRVLKSLADCTAVELRRHVEVLEHFDFLHRDDEPFDGPPLYIVGNSTPGIGWALLRDLRQFAGTDHAIMRRILCDLDFSVLDK